MFGKLKKIRRYNFFAAEVVILLTIGAAIALPAMHRAKERAGVASCINNNKQLVWAISTYAGDNDNWYPPAAGKDGLQLLRPYLDDNERIFRCPVSGKEDNFYAYYGNGLKCAMLGNCPGAIPILACHNHNGTEFVVVYGDGHVMQLDAGKLFSTHENLVRYAFENSSFKGCENKAWEIVLENARTLGRNNRK